MLTTTAELLILSGLPACGKSTYAKAWVAEAPLERERLNYDELRKELGVDHSRGFNRRSENLMKDTARQRVEKWLTQHRSVVIDNTNLSQRVRNEWKALAKGLGAGVNEYHLDTPLNVCLARDAKRPMVDRCGRAVIERMALFNGFIDWAELPVILKDPDSAGVVRDVVICDIDGTVANCSHRLHHVKDSNHRWDLFHAEVDKDSPYEDIIELLDALSATHHVIFVSGRSTDHGCGIKTEEWLQRHVVSRGIPYCHLFMRQSGDMRPDHEIKAEILGLLPKDRVNFVIDDRDQVVEKCWRAAGLRCLQVAKGDF